MNFLNELEKKKIELGECNCGIKKHLHCKTSSCVGFKVKKKTIDFKDIKKIYLESQRFFWNKRKKEIEKRIRSKEKERIDCALKFEAIRETKLEGNVIELRDELSWIEKQLKEVKEK